VSKGSIRIQQYFASIGRKMTEPISGKPSCPYVKEIRANADLVELVLESVELKRYGRDRYKGRCPFHGDSTPSFTVDNNLYFCFGCQEGGDAIRFVQQIKGLSFRAALEYLGDRYGVQPDGEVLYRTPRPRRRPVQGIRQPVGYVAPAVIPPAVYDPTAAALFDECRTDHYDNFLTAGIVPTALIKELEADVYSVSDLQ
jgi:hypothetical protein